MDEEFNETLEAPVEEPVVWTFRYPGLEEIEFAVGDIEKVVDAMDDFEFASPAKMAGIKATLRSVITALSPVAVEEGGEAPEGPEV